MNPPSDAVPVPAVDSQANVPAAQPTRPLYWSVRREVWENRSIYIAPLAVAAVTLFGSLISVIVRAHNMRTLPAIEPASQLASVVRPFRVAPAPIMLATLVVGVFYALEALYSERRDRRILFWKSLPVSDLTIVLSKASIPLVVLPLIGFVLSVVAQFSLLVMATLVLPGSGVSAARLWAEVGFFQGIPVMLYGLTAHVLWFAPIYGWLLLVSAWARRTPVLWAVMPLLAIGALEKLAFGSSHFAALLVYRVTGAMTEAFAAEAQNGHVDRLAHLDPARFLTTPGLWIGLGAAAVFLAATVRLRRDREPI